MTILEALKSVSAYPVPREALEEIACRREFSLEGELTKEMTRSANYNLARADALRWLARAPFVGQGGQMYTMTDKQRDDMMALANRIAEKYGEDLKDPARGVIYGYKGSSL